MTSDDKSEGWRGGDVTLTDNPGGFERDGRGGPFLSNFQKYLEENGNNGLVVNGVILWIDIQMNSTALEVWKSIAMARFTVEEVREGKRNLWMASGHHLGGPLPRIGDNAKASDLKDI